MDSQTIAEYVALGDKLRDDFAIAETEAWERHLKRTKNNGPPGPRAKRFLNIQEIQFAQDSWMTFWEEVRLAAVTMYDAYMARESSS